MPYQIEIESSEINEERIYITSSATIHVNIPCLPSLDITKLQENIKNIQDMGRKKEIKVTYQDPRYKGIRQYNAYISQLLSEYKVECEKYSKLYKELVALWKSKAEKGLFAPLSDDAEYNEIVSKGWVLTKMLNRNQPIGLVMDLTYDIENLIDRLGDLSGENKIIVGL